MFSIKDWIVIPGGPGLSKEYLKKPFDMITSGLGINLHYYDQYGAPESVTHDDVTISDLVEQIRIVANEKGLKKFGLIAHSFGTYISLRFAEKYSEMLEAMIFINPMPLIYSFWRKSLGDIAAKVLPSAQKEIEIEVSRVEDNDGSRLFSLLFPFYCAKSEVESPKVSFKLKMCNYLANQVASYDDTRIFETLGIPVAVILGDCDPFYVPGMFPQHSVILLKEVGHYPFYEDIKQFKESLTEVEQKLCRKKTIKITA